MTEQIGGVKRLQGITILAILEIIWGIYWALGWGLTLMVDISEGVTGSLLLIPIMEFLMGSFYIVIGWGIWILKLWAAQGAKILAIYGIIMSILQFLAGYIPILLVMHGGVFWYLRQQRVKECFAAANFPIQSG